MSKTVSHEIMEKIESAKQAIADAERDLATVLADFESGGQRAEKRHVGEPLGVALGRLRVAQTELATLTELLAK